MSRIVTRFVNIWSNHLKHTRNTPRHRWSGTIDNVSFILQMGIWILTFVWVHIYFAIFERIENFKFNLHTDTAVIWKL